MIDQRIILPGCKIRNSQCLVGNQWVIWVPPRRNCPLEKVRELQLLARDEIKIYTDHKVVLHTAAEIPAPDTFVT